MLSKIGSVSRRAFSEKESLIASETLNDGDDLFITASFQPGEENSSVMGNSSYVGYLEAPPMPFENDKNIYAEPSDSTVTSTSTESIDAQSSGATRLSLPQRLTRTIPKRDQLSKLKEDMPWAIYGNDNVSRLANDTLDAGDDIHISASCDQDDFSVIGNSSVAPFDSQSTAGEMEEDYRTSVSSAHAMKAKTGLFRKLSLTKKITRMLPSKQYVSKLSRLAEDVPWSMNSQEQISRQADEMLNDGDDLFISESFEPLEGDASSVLGNLSYVSAAKSTLGSGSTADEKRDDISSNETFMNETRKTLSESKAGRTGILKTPVTEKLKNAIPAPITETLKSAIPVAEKLKSAIPSPVTQKLKGVPGSVVSSSQKLMPRRLKSMVSSQKIRTGPLSEYQEFGDDTRDSAKDFLLPSNYQTETPGDGIKRRPRIRPTQLSSRDPTEQNTAFSLSTSNESSRSRSLSWDDGSCSDMSDITEPSVYSRTRSFRKARSMYILPAGESLLGSGDEDSEAGTEGNGSTTSSSNFLGFRLIKQTGDPSMANLPDINESKPFNAMSSTEIFSPSVVNGFLNRMESNNDKPINNKSEGPWEAVSTLGTEVWQHTPLSDIHDSALRQRVFSDSDVSYEFQRSAKDTDEIPNSQMTGTLKGLNDDDSLTFFLDNADSTDESEATHRQVPPSGPHTSFHDSEFPVHPRDKNDLWTPAKLSSSDFVEDDENASWSQRPSNPKNISDNGAEKDLDVDAIDAEWKPRHRFISESNAIRNSSAEHTIDVDDDSGWSPRPRFASDSEAISTHGAEKATSKSTRNTNVADAIWSQRPRFASDNVITVLTEKNVIDVDITDSLWRSNAPFATGPFNLAASNENTVDVDAAESSWEFSSNSETTADEPVPEKTLSSERDGTWSQNALFNPDSEVTSEGNTVYSSTEDFVAVIGVEEQDSHPDDETVTENTSIGERDGTWSRNALFNPDSEATSEGTTAYSSTEDVIGVIDVDEQDSHPDDEPVTQNTSNDVKDGTWSRNALFNPDSEATSEGTTAYSSTEDVVAVIDVDEQDSHPDDESVTENTSNDEKDGTWSRQTLFETEVTSEGNSAYGSTEDFIAVIDVEDSHTDSSWSNGHTFTPAGMIISEEDAPEHDVGSDPSWTQRHRFSSDPVESKAEVAASTILKEKTIEVDTDASWNPRSRFFSDPIGISEQTLDYATGAEDHFSSSHGRRFPTNSVARKDDATTDIDRESSSSDEKPRFSPASVAINDNADNSEIEISLHGEAWRWGASAQHNHEASERTTLGKTIEAEVEPEEHDGEKVSHRTTTTHDYYWNEASDSEDDAEEILLFGHQSDSFGDIL